MHIENFKIFSDLVESQSFSRAAKMNGITQSAVSQQLRTTEKYFGVTIVDRSQKQFRLTREGEKLYASSKEILHMYEKLASELLEMKNIISGTIHISTVYSIGLHGLPPYIKLFLREFPAVNIRVEYRRSNLVYEDVIQNTSDFGLVAYPSYSRQLEVISYHEDQLVVVCSPLNAFADYPEIYIEELKDVSVIGFEKDIPTRRATDQLFKEAKLSGMEPVMEFDNIETVKRAVEIDAGIAIVPETTITQEVIQGTLKKIPIAGKDCSRPLALVHRKGRILTPAMKKFIQLLTEKKIIHDEQEDPPTEASEVYLEIETKPSVKVRSKGKEKVKKEPTIEEPLLVTDSSAEMFRDMSALI